MLAPGSTTRLTGALPVGRLDAGGVFMQAYGELRPALEGRADGALIAVLEPTGQVAGRIWIRARDHRPRCAIIGRHPHCAVSVPWADELSLRHLAVLVRRAGSRVEVRMLDLLSGWGFFSERALPLESITMDGTGFFQIGPLLVALIVTRAGDPWPVDPGEAYARIPPRTLQGVPEGAELLGPQLTPRIRTNVRAMDGPMRFPAENTASSPDATGLLAVNPRDLDEEDAPEDELLRERHLALARALAGEHPLGELVIVSELREEVVAIGAEALDRGIVLGRHDRCASRGLSALADPSLSRVHLLVTRSAEQVLAFDAASSNGSWLGSMPVNGAALHQGQVVRLGPGAAWVSWKPLP